MQLLYSAEITASNKTLTVPFGVKRCKMRSSAQTPIITGIGPIGTTAINACTSWNFQSSMAQALILLLHPLVERKYLPSMYWLKN